MRQWCDVVVAVLAALGAVASLEAGRAEAAPLVWNTCEGGSDSVCNISSSVNLPESPRTGNSSALTFQAIGDPSATLTARAFITPDVAGVGDPVSTSIAVFEGGLGAGGGSSPQHAVDNDGRDEFIVLTLPSDATRPLSFRIGWKYQDADISTWIGGTLGGPNDALNLLNGSGLWNQGGLLTSNGYIRQDFLDVPVGALQTFTLNATGRYLIIGARHEGSCASTCTEGGEDHFKLLQVTADASVPEPATLLMLVTAAGALLAAGRLRR